MPFFVCSFKITQYLAYNELKIPPLPPRLLHCIQTVTGCDRMRVQFILIIPKSPPPKPHFKLMSSPMGFPRRSPSLSLMSEICLSNCPFSSTCVSYRVFHSLPGMCKECITKEGRQHESLTPVLITSHTFSIDTVQSVLQFTHRTPQIRHRLVKHLSVAKTKLIRRWSSYFQQQKKQP